MIIIIIIIIIINFICFKFIVINLRDATGINTPVEWNSCLDYESAIPRSPFTEIGAVQYLLLDRHVISKDSRCPGQIVSWRCDLSISNTPVRWKVKDQNYQLYQDLLHQPNIARLEKFNYVHYAFQLPTLSSRIP